MCVHRHTYTVSAGSSGYLHTVKQTLSGQDGRADSQENLLPEVGWEMLDATNHTLTPCRQIVVRFLATIALPAHE